MDLGLLTIKKNNALTDGNIPDRKVMANKLLNALYFKYEQEGDTFRIAINDLAELLGRNRNCGKTKQMISDGLKILQQPIEIRNFEYEGKSVKWMSAPFLSRATIYNEDKNYIEINLDDMLIEALKQKEHYTVIDLEISNKFLKHYIINRLGVVGDVLHTPLPLIHSFIHCLSHPFLVKCIATSKTSKLH